MPVQSRLLAVIFSGAHATCSQPLHGQSLLWLLLLEVERHLKVRRAVSLRFHRCCGCGAKPIERISLEKVRCWRRCLMRLWLRLARVLVLLWCTAKRHRHRLLLEASRKTALLRSVAGACPGAYKSRCRRRGVPDGRRRIVDRIHVRRYARSSRHLLSLHITADCLLS